MTRSSLDDVREGAAKPSVGISQRPGGGAGHQRRDEVLLPPLDGQKGPRDGSGSGGGGGGSSGGEGSPGKGPGHGAKEVRACTRPLFGST
jgi:hypothetical protein